MGILSRLRQLKMDVPPLYSFFPCLLADVEDPVKGFKDIKVAKIYYGISSDSWMIVDQSPPAQPSPTFSKQDWTVTWIKK